MDLASLNSVRALANAYLSRLLPLHILINNAGIMNTPFNKTVDGIEAQFQVNHLGHFLLTSLLLPRMLESGGRVITLSSRAHMRHPQLIDFAAVTGETEFTYNGWTAYARSKLSNILFSRALAKRFPLTETNITFNSLHPVG
jgi:NAD(P)-dependent dehydrogenase (short-subunit alcohol dehydrogenase family)